MMPTLLLGGARVCFPTLITAAAGGAGAGARASGAGGNGSGGGGFLDIFADLLRARPTFIYR
jgi:hypothetical protein